ncbi:unnamed protein product, partial [Hymenolepis diminuta]
SHPTKNDVRFLRENNINAILTVQSSALTDGCFSSFKKMFVLARDHEEEVLLNHFEDAFNFIDENIENGVLVHCHFGRS